MRRILVLGALAGCLGLAGVAGFAWLSPSGPGTTSGAPPAGAAAPGQAAAPAPKGTPLPWTGIEAYRTEEEWVVSDIAAAVVGLADFARGGTAPQRKMTVRAVRTPGASGAPGAWLPGESVTREGGTFQLKSGSDLDGLIEIRGYLWAPDNFTGLAESALGPLVTAGDATASAGPEPPSPLVQELADPSVEHLLAANRDISDRLSRRVSAAAAHEEAALLIGTMALRESAGLLSDSRSELSRLTAHLAFARALRHGAPRSVAGTIAEAILLTLVNRQADALDRVKTIEAAAGTPGAASWARALTLRITNDWRKPLPSNASTIERLSYARALRSQLSGVRALDYVERQDLTARVDWQRLMLTGSFSVEAGHWFTDDGMANEFDEMALVRSSYQDDKAAPPLVRGAATRAELLSRLNDLPSASPVVTRAGTDVKAGIEVIDWGRWAAFLQRHLCGYLAAEFTHLSNLGADDEKRAQTAKRAPEFEQLRLFPLVRRRLAMTQADYDTAVQATIRLAGAHPETISPASWETFVKKPEKLTAGQFPPMFTWFQPGVPTGTAMDLHIRTMTPYWREDANTAQFERWVVLAPYDGWAIWMKLWHDTKGKPTLEDGLRAHGPALDYQAAALVRIFDHTVGDPEAFVPVARRMCELNADRCYSLAWQLVNVGDSKGAANAFERYAAEARDRVVVSNHMYWLVDYYLDQGYKPRAFHLARMAAATGSSRGMETLAHVLERTGDLEKAEEIFRAIADRYSNSQDMLGAFCIRLARRTGDKADMEQGTRLLSKALPGGLESWWPSDAAQPPTDGARVTFTFPRAKRLGLRENDVVVAIDGLRVRDANARPSITNLRIEPDMTLVVWRDGRYEELKLDVPQRWFGALFETYNPAEQKAAAAQQ